MKKFNKIFYGLLTCLAVVLVLGAGVRSSLAYFTTYVTAKGGYTISLQSVRTEVTENRDGATKIIGVTSVGPGDCYVRVYIYSGDVAEIKAGGEGWHQESDGYYYYELPLAAGETAPELRIDVTPIKDKLIDKDFDVIVYEECILVEYDADGNPLYANNPANPGWNGEG